MTSKGENVPNCTSTNAETKKPRQYTGALKACLLKKSCNRKGSCPKHSDKIHCCRYEKLNYLPCR